jgi:hypothetical protein
MICPTSQAEPTFVPKTYSDLILPKARAHVAVYEDTGSEWVPVGYARSPWAVVRNTARHLYQRAWFSNNTTTAMVDVSNVSHNVTPNGTNGFSRNAGTYTLRWGTSNQAAVNTDKDVVTLVDFFNSSATVFDGTNITASISGSKVYTGANTTLREVGMTVNYTNQSLAQFTFSLDRTVVADRAVNTNQTVAIQYDWAL